MLKIPGLPDGPAGGRPLRSTAFPIGKQPVPAAAIRTLLVQDRIPANRPLQDAVAAKRMLELVGTVWTLERVELALRTQSPELVLVDWALAAAAASHVCHVIKVRLLAPKVIGLVPEDDLFHRHAAALAGADAILAKRDPEEGLVRALALLFPDRATS
jgi:DNA-binding NarL/FixJ family response regulator